jgi:phosphoribosylglycinamide formyltransferase-1
MKRIAIFASGAGTNAKKIIAHFKNSSHVQVALLVCNKPNAGVLTIAKEEGVPVLLIERELFFEDDRYVKFLKDQQIDWIILAGFLWKIPANMIAGWGDRIINIHPALLPNYGGKGMYGEAVHQAVLNAGDSKSGITIHYVNEHYDEGATIFQATCPVFSNDTSHTLATRIHELEHAHYPRVIEEVVTACELK